MSLAKKIKCFRREHSISQEYMAEKLCMSQSTYSRLEDNDMKCTAYLTRIAEALDTTPELLQQYHVGLDSYAETDASLEKQLAGKENIIQSQADYIKFLNLFINYTQAVLRNYLRKRI